MSLPVTVLTGFLGAGKTTLLVRLLREAPDAGAAVILNEIGIAGTDGNDQTSFLELTEGCVCCVRADDLRGALEAVAARPDVRRIIIETTGVADPLALTFVLERPDLEELCRLDAVITVVDAANWETTRGPEWDAQVGAADLVVVSKLDLAPEGGLARLRAAIAELAPAARLIEGAPDPQVLLGVERTARPGREHAQHSGYHAISIVDAEPHDAGAVEDLLERLPAEVYRGKGVVRCDRWLSFHTVAGRLQVDVNAPAPAHGETRVVFIGRGLDETRLRERFAATIRSR